MKKTFKYVFGPVSSRRLGQSLGVDIVPFKTCSYDCIYCQLGKTTNMSIRREVFVPIDRVIEELRYKLNVLGIDANYITLAGSGEPTLNLLIGRLISEIKTITNIPIAVITNGSLLFDEDVQNSLMEADLVIPNLDVGDEAIFKYINRPHLALDFLKVVEGIICFRKKFRGKFWLEVFLLRDINTSENNLLKIKSFVDKINPDCIQLNTAIRPVVEDYALSASKRELELAMQIISKEVAPLTKVEIISSPVEKYEHSPEISSKVKIASLTEVAPLTDILALLRRRPCTLMEIANALRMSHNKMLEYIRILQEERLIQETLRDGRTYFVWCEGSSTNYPFCKRSGIRRQVSVLDHKSRL